MFPRISKYYAINCEGPYPEISEIEIKHEVLTPRFKDAEFLYSYYTTFVMRGIRTSDFYSKLYLF